MATKAAAPLKSTGNATAATIPSRTLYCKNLPDRLNKSDLRRALYMLFSTYGTVLDVVALKTAKMRGQAHIVFRDVQSSTQAMRALQGFEFFEKEMKIDYARTKSNTIAKMDGTFHVQSSAPANTATELQRLTFGAPPSSNAASNVVGKASTAAAAADIGSPQGVKRPREESDGEDVSMDEEEDDEAMDESDDD